MVTYPEQSANDFHKGQLMPLLPLISCTLQLFVKIQNG